VTCRHDELLTKQVFSAINSRRERTWSPSSPPTSATGRVADQISETALRAEFTIAI
jgi:hypothetical protein